MYETVFTKKGEKDFDSLTDDLKERVAHVLERISIDPYKYIRKLKGGKLFRTRVGDYRIIIDIDENKKKIVVLRIGHRKNVYDW